jgi:ketosteroid isomerase-like protein
MTATQSITDQNKQLVLSLYAAIRNADLEGFFAGCSPDMVLHEAESMKVGGTYRGRDEITNCLGQLLSLYDLTTVDVKRIVADGEYVVGMVSFMTSGPTPHEVKLSEWWHILDGKVVEVRPFYWDTAVLNRVLAER